MWTGQRGGEPARRDCCLHRQALSVQPGNDLLVAADAILQNLEGCCCQEVVCQHTQEGRQVGVQGLILFCRRLLSGGVDRGPAEQRLCEGTEALV